VPPAEAFLSHSSTDRRFVNRLVTVLVRHGVPVFCSKKSIRGAQQWHDEIGAALARCDWFLLVLSPRSVASKWVKHELLFALRSDQYEGRIVPILYRTCDADRLSWTLSSFQRIEFANRFVEGCRELLALWGIGYAGPAKERGPTATPSKPTRKALRGRRRR